MAKAGNTSLPAGMGLATAGCSSFRATSHLEGKKYQAGEEYCSMPWWKQILFVLLQADLTLEKSKAESHICFFINGEGNAYTRVCSKLVTADQLFSRARLLHLLHVIASYGQNLLFPFIILMFQLVAHSEG